MDDRTQAMPSVLNPEKLAYLMQQRQNHSE
jgi:hypothetical protein